jgi:hypothetical protein
MRAFVVSHPSRRIAGHEEWALDSVAKLGQSYKVDPSAPTEKERQAREGKIRGFPLLTRSAR